MAWTYESVFPWDLHYWTHYSPLHELNITLHYWTYIIILFPFVYLFSNWGCKLAFIEPRLKMGIFNLISLWKSFIRNLFIYTHSGWGRNHHWFSPDFQRSPWPTPTPLPKKKKKNNNHEKNTSDFDSDPWERILTVYMACYRHLVSTRCLFSSKVPAGRTPQRHSGSSLEGTADTSGSRTQKKSELQSVGPLNHH